VIDYSRHLLYNVATQTLSEVRHVVCLEAQLTVDSIELSWYRHVAVSTSPCCVRARCAFIAHRWPLCLRKISIARRTAEATSLDRDPS